MPRAYYKPFTVYEEVVGFHGTKRNAYICCALLFGGLLFKVLVLSQYCTVADIGDTTHLQDNPQYQALTTQRDELADIFASREGLQRAMRARRPPPA